ncbi:MULTISPECIES: cytochrome P450 [Pseudofrankia]|uniref:cytochrome P450 n=1 Tax=Pseudofrankia TaxID=2994363 RepID=UPI000234D546|nr:MULTISPECIES: cytochrome P450 [Pseudofrankia]OHV34202.1 cytochrome [Pseudofrankia sp. EUN1h]
MTTSPELTTPTGCPVSTLAAAFDPFESAYQAHPGKSMAAARKAEPVFYSPVLDYWVVTRYDDIKEIFKDTDTFSASITLDQITPSTDETIAILVQHGFNPGLALVNEDGPSHRERRMAHQDPFKGREVEALVPRIREIVNGYIDAFVKKGRADLMADLFQEAPITIALIFMGIPDEDIAACRQFTLDQTVFMYGRPSPEEQKQVASNLGRYWEFSGGLVEKIRQASEGPGWLPHLIRESERKPGLFGDNELQTTALAGLVAAHETTTNASGNAMRALLENPRTWERVCADPELIPKAAEESLRYDGSVAAWRRLAVKETTVGGVTIPKDARVMMITSSANHDEAVFEDPERFDIDRPNPNRHMTFGFGAHACMGATLARQEMRIFIEELARRLPHLRLVGEQRITYLPNTSFRGPQHLLVEWDPQLNPVPADRP